MSSTREKKGDGTGVGDTHAPGDMGKREAAPQRRSQPLAREGVPACPEDDALSLP